MEEYLNQRYSQEQEGLHLMVAGAAEALVQHPPAVEGETRLLEVEEALHPLEVEAARPRACIAGNRYPLPSGGVQLEPQRL